MKMSKLWQLKKLSDGSALNEPQPLPENWGPIFGLHGFIDQIGDLSWLGEAYNDMGWVEVGDAPPGPAVSSTASLAWDRAKKLLAESDWAMLPDIPMTSEKKAAWIEYRRVLRDMRMQSGFPEDIKWPSRPE
jgi:hypothetical protein